MKNLSETSNSDIYYESTFYKWLTIVYLNIKLYLGYFDNSVL